MVIWGKREKQRSPKPLYNFDTPTPFLRWGDQRLLRCSKSDPFADGEFLGQRKSTQENNLQEETDRVKVAISQEGSSAVARPWNLRNRKNNLSLARKEFSVSLSMEEIVEDFAEMVGHRPPRKPKKRAKTVQKELDEFVPGL